MRRFVGLRQPGPAIRTIRRGRAEPQGPVWGVPRPPPLTPLPVSVSSHHSHAGVRDARKCAVMFYTHTHTRAHAHTQTHTQMRSDAVHELDPPDVHGRHRPGPGNSDGGSDGGSDGKITEMAKICIQSLYFHVTRCVATIAMSRCIFTAHCCYTDANSLCCFDLHIWSHRHKDVAALIRSNSRMNATDFKSF